METIKPIPGSLRSIKHLLQFQKYHFHYCSEKYVISFCMIQTISMKCYAAIQCLTNY